MLNRSGSFILLFLCSLHVFGQWNYLNPVPTPEGYAAMKFVDQLSGYALTVNGTFTGTTDGGLTWGNVKQVSFSKCRCTDMTFLSKEKGFIVGAKGLLLRTVNGGQSWEPIPSGTESDLLSIFMFSDSTGYVTGLQGTILKTVNGGSNWQLIVPNVIRDFYDCFFTRAGQGFIAANQGVYKTSDGGYTWNEVLHADSGYNFIKLNFIDSLTGFAIGRKGGIFKTSNGGITWNRKTSNTETNLNDIVFVNRQIGFIAANNGLILRSSDEGNHWLAVQTGFQFGFGGLAFTGLTNGSAFGPLGSICRTGDGGSSWVPATFATLSNLFAISFLDEQDGFAAGSAGTVVKTADGGDTWTRVPTGSTLNMSDICMVSREVVYLAGEQGKLMKTSDGGSSWTALTTPAPISWSSLFFTDPVHGFLTGISPVIYKTQDGGTTWTAVETGTNAAINSIGFSKAVGYACGSGATLLKSTDGGISWKKISVPELYEANLNKIITVNENVCYVVGNQYITNSWVMFFAGTQDGGKNWKVKTFDFSPAKTFMSLYFTDSLTGYAGGSDFLWKTMDGGDSWIDQTPAMSQSGPNDICFVNNHTGFSTGFYGQILKTTNGGGLGLEEPRTSRVTYLGQNFPNPANGLTCISYRVEKPDMIRLIIRDCFGQVVTTLVNSYQQQGGYSVDFDTKKLAPGLYFYSLVSAQGVETRKMIIRQVIP